MRKRGLAYPTGCSLASFANSNAVPKIVVNAPNHEHRKKKTTESKSEICGPSSDVVCREKGDRERERGKAGERGPPRGEMSTRRV
jgi:hypothetical protein